MRRGIAHSLLLAAAGFASGLLGGLLGAGGGIIAAFALGRALGPAGQKAEQHDPAAQASPHAGAVGRESFANTLALMLPLSAFSSAVYALKGASSPALISRLALPAIAGGLAGGLLLGKIDQRILRLIFSLLVVWSGFSMLMRG